MASAFVDCHGTSQLLGLHDLEFCGQETNPDDSGRHADGSQGGQKPRIEMFGQFMSIPWIPTRTVWDLGSLEFDRSLGVVAL